MPSPSTCRSRRPFPVDYIDSDKLRLEAYQKLASARTEDDLDELRDELTDRYGKPPVDFEALFDVARLRFKGSQARHFRDHRARTQRARVEVRAA